MKTRALFGNETWLREHGAMADQDLEQLHRMKLQGKSTVLIVLDNTGIDTTRVLRHRKKRPGVDFFFKAISAGLTNQKSRD